MNANIKTNAQWDIKWQNKHKRHALRIADEFHNVKDHTEITRHVKRSKLVTVIMRYYFEKQTPVCVRVVFRLAWRRQPPATAGARNGHAAAPLTPPTYNNVEPKNERKTLQILTWIPV